MFLSHIWTVSIFFTVAQRRAAQSIVLFKFSHKSYYVIPTWTFSVCSVKIWAFKDLDSCRGQICGQRTTCSTGSFNIGVNICAVIQQSDSCHIYTDLKKQGKNYVKSPISQWSDKTIPTSQDELCGQTSAFCPFTRFKSSPCNMHMVTI